MIYVRDKGQMCNNILQFAHVYAFAAAHGREAVSMRFSYKYPYFRICRTRRHNPVRYALAKFAAARGLMPVVSYDTPGEKSAEKERRILEARNVMVQGWEVRFYEEFLSRREEIRQLFTFLPKVEEAVAPLLAGTDGALRVGIHVRRGDYARWQGGKYFFSDEQYARVARGIADLYPGRRMVFYVCGNDPALDEETFRKALTGVDVRFPKGNPGEDLCLLSHCDILAGAPSTFSLMAAFYRDLPLYWIADPAAPVGEESFKKFDYLFRHII